MVKNKVRYDVPMKVYLSSKEDRKLIDDINSTYGVTISEKLRNYLRWRSGIDYENILKGAGDI